MLKILIGVLLLLSINSKNYDLDDILDAATRDKNFVLAKNALPNIVRVVNDQLPIVQFTYVMALAIRNINEGNPEAQVSPISLTSPSSIHECKLQLSLSEYIDAINRVINYCQDNGAAPAYVLSKSVEIGYREYSFGFSKILDYYRTHKKLPTNNEFDSSVFEPIPYDDPDNPDLYFAKGINQKKTESDVSNYITKEDSKCKRDQTIINKARELTNNKNTNLEKARTLFNFVRDNIEYKYYYNSQRGATKTLVMRGGNCSDQSNLLVALCRASNIPVRYVHGLDCRFSSGVYGHVWTQILIDNTWYVADPISKSNTLGHINNWNYKSYSLQGIYALLSF